MIWSAALRFARFVALLNRWYGVLQHADDGAGLPAASAVELRIARVVVAIVTVCFALSALWEIGAPFGAGHDAAACAVTVAGENMWKFHTLIPITELLAHTPTSADCYCHHPFGVFWTAAIARALFGHHDFVCRLPAVLLSACTPWLIYRLGRALWSPLSGAVAALAFALTPIALAFANFNALEVPMIFGVTLTSLAYVRFRQALRWRFFGLTLLGLAYTLNTDWPAYVFAAGLLALLFVRTFVGARSLADATFRRHAQLFAWSLFVIGAIAAAYTLALSRLNQLNVLWAQGALRATGADRPLADVLGSRHYWLSLMFTPLAIFVGKLGAIVWTLRTLFKRSELEALPLVILAMSLFQYLVFSQGADIHVFWPHYFALCFALGLGAIQQSVADVAQRLLVSRNERWLPQASLLGFALAALVPLRMAPDAISALHYARKTGGRFNERGWPIQADHDKSAALAYLGRQLQPSDGVNLHTNMKRSLWVPWVLGHPSRTYSSTVLQRPGHLVFDERWLDSSTLQSALEHTSVRAFGPYWHLASGAQQPLDGYALVQREPNFWEKYFVSSHHALVEVEPDPFLTWELRDMLAQSPNPAPTIEPRTNEQLRVAHNIALRAGNATRAALLRNRLLSGVDRRPATEYNDGTHLLGVRFESGASDMLTVYFDSPGPDDQRFVIRSIVEAAPRMSLVQKDALEWQVSQPSWVPRSSWRPGYIYSVVSELLRRPGRERYLGSWLNTGHNLPLIEKGGPRPVTLLVLP